MILIETMAQTGVVAFGLYLSWIRPGGEEMEELTTLFTLADDWSSPAWSGPASGSWSGQRRSISAGTRKQGLHDAAERREVCSGVLAGKGAIARGVNQ